MKFRVGIAIAGAVALMAAGEGVAQANIIVLSAAAANTGNLTLQGTGDGGDADTLGEGRFEPGTCSFAAGFTTCLITGGYLTGGGSDPIDNGTFSLRFVYAGSGLSPWLIEEQTANSNIFVGTTLGGGQIQLDLFPTTGSPVSAVSPLTFFSFGYVGATCTVVATCGVSNVLQTPGATITGGGNITMTIVQTVPEPATLLLLGSGLAAAIVARRRRA